MAESGPYGDETIDEAWRPVLDGTAPVLRRFYRIFRHIPAAPRCKFCAAPFGGVGAPLMRAIGRDRWHKNPKFCRFCFGNLEARHGGAEIELSLLFADVRGSTSLAEKMRPTEFKRLMDDFYRTASALLIDRDAIVDKFVGDEVMAIFIPALAQQHHARRAIDSASELVRKMRGRHPPVPVGAGVHTGTAFVGSVGDGPRTDFTALGDAVNVAARLASSAAAGEVLITTAAAAAGGLDTDRAERRHLALRGRSEPVEVLVLRGPDAD